MVNKRTVNGPTLIALKVQLMLAHSQAVAVLAVLLLPEAGA